MVALVSSTFILGLVLAIVTFPTWHIRWLGNLFYYFFLRRYVQSTEADRLFAPTSKTSRCFPFEYDINGHKSNSTYFLDADIAVGELIPRFASKSFHLRRKANKFVFPRLGAVGAVFLKEIRLFQSYRLSTRVVTWDSKWVYIATKFSFPSPGDKSRKETIFAIVLTKAIFKQGRETIPPEVVFQESELLPIFSTRGASPPATKVHGDTHGIADVWNSGNIKDETWSRESVEERRKRGLSLVKGLLDVESFRDMESESSISEIESMHSLW